MSLKDNVRQDALRHLANEYNIEEDSANRRLKLAQSLLDQLLKHGNLKVSDQEKLYSSKVLTFITLVAL